MQGLVFVQIRFEKCITNFYFENSEVDDYYKNKRQLAHFSSVLHFYTP